MAGGPPDSWLDNDPFEGDSDLEPWHPEEEGTFQEWLEANGVADYNEVIVDLANARTENLRGQRFFSAAEAFQWLYDTGLISFSRVVRVPPETEWDDWEYGAEVNESGTVIYV